MKTFARHKTFEEVAAQCVAQGVPLNAAMYISDGWDTILVGTKKHGYVVYNTFNGKFFGAPHPSTSAASSG